MACADCFKGFIRTDKQATGTVSTVYGLPTYVSLPPSTGPAKGIIVFVPDAFGWEFVNNRILCDTYAAAGFRVYLPDFMDGLAVPTYFLDCMKRLTSLSSVWDWVCKPWDFFWILVGIGPFIWKNWPSKSHPRVVGFLEQLKAKPVAEDKGLKVGVAGFCWGGKHVMMLADKKEAHLIDSVFTAHPSMVKLPDEAESATRPISIAVGDGDEWMPLDTAKQVEAILKGLESKIDGMKSEVVIYKGAGHGFSVRIDAKNPKQVEQSVEAEKQAINWFEETLK